MKLVFIQVAWGRFLEAAVGDDQVEGIQVRSLRAFRTGAFIINIVICLQRHRWGHVGAVEGTSLFFTAQVCLGSRDAVIMEIIDY